MDALKQTRILALDSSSLTGSVALCQGEMLIAESLLNVRSTHSEKLLQQIDLLLKEAGWVLADIDLYVAVTGPGSFTGLRIGLATIQGLAQVHGKPVVGVTSLATVAQNLPLVEGPFCVFLDARKKEVYAQLFAWRDGVARGVEEAVVCPPEPLLRSFTGDIALVGDGVMQYSVLIDAVLGGRAKLPPIGAHQIRASQAARLGLQLFSQGQTLRPDELLPSYIRPSDAELNLSVAQRSKQGLSG
jgi:tRNA threonylcarbamoyladenosine biosynthesis protein TsaB